MKYSELSKLVKDIELNEEQRETYYNLGNSVVDENDNIYPVEMIWDWKVLTGSVAEWIVDNTRFILVDNGSDAWIFAEIDGDIPDADVKALKEVGIIK